MLADLLRDYFDDRGVGEHAGLDRVGPDIVDHRVDLRADELWAQCLNLPDADGVLRGNRGNRRSAVDPESGKGFKIGLNACSRARVGAGDGENFTD